MFPKLRWNMPKKIIHDTKTVRECFCKLLSADESSTTKGIKLISLFYLSRKEGNRTSDLGVDLGSKRKNSFILSFIRRPVRPENFNFEVSDLNTETSSELPNKIF